MLKQEFRNPFARFLRNTLREGQHDLRIPQFLYIRKFQLIRIRRFGLILLTFILISCVHTQTNVENMSLSGIDSLKVDDIGNVAIVCDLILIIERPVEDVFAYLIDPSTVPDWQPDIVKQTKITEGPTRVGTLFLNLRKSLLKDFEYEREVVEYIPFKTYSYNNLDSSLKFNVKYNLEPVKNGTKIEISGKFLEPTTGHYQFLPQWLLRHAIKYVFVKHHKLLKMNLESKNSENVNK